jgi:hypothetical protein
MVFQRPKISFWQNAPVLVKRDNRRRDKKHFVIKKYLLKYIGFKGNKKSPEQGLLF